MKNLINAAAFIRGNTVSTIRDCDMILVLKDGEVEEFDEFDTLVNKKGDALSEMAQVADIYIRQCPLW